MTGLIGPALALALAAPALAQQPTAAPLPPPLPPPVDRPYPGTLTIAVDARDAAQGIFRVTETIPVAGPGPLTLLYPQWKPGEHGPTGPIANLAGLTFTAGGRALTWRRDTVNIYAFHLDVPAGARTVTAQFQYLGPLAPGPTRRVTSAALVNLDWDEVSLYPAGWYVRDIPIKPSVTFPEGWTAFTALRGRRAGATTDYGTVPYDVLIDSPVAAGRYTRQIALDPTINLDLVGDSDEAVTLTPAELAEHKALVMQADKLFGTRHFDHYDFLLTVSDLVGEEGLEHHRSSEDSATADFLSDQAKNIDFQDLLPHEYTHSWNGKFRRPADLWTPDYATPMQDTLLWVYEGQTQFWGDVLAARAGFWTKQQYLDYLAGVAATYTQGTPGVSWRPLQDTTNEPIVRRGSTYNSWSRGVDYYANGELVWLDVDQTLRRLTSGAKGIDDFARSFFGVHPGVWETEDTYTFEDVVAALNATAPYDWAGFLRARLDQTSSTNTLNGITAGGYRLVFTEQPSDFAKAAAGDHKTAEFTYSLGLTIGEGGKVRSVLWNGPAYRAGLSPDDTIIAVDGFAYDGKDLAGRIAAAKDGRQPLVLLVRAQDTFRTVSIDYHGGLRYPHLVATGAGPAGIDRLISPR